MPETKMIGRCPACGRELEVPAALESFCCLYCGERLTYDRLEAAPAPEPAEIQALLAKLGGCLTGRRGLLEHFTRTQYAAAFEGYRAECRPLLERLSAACAAPQGGEALPAQAAQRMLADFAAELEADGRWASGSRRVELMTEARMLLAVCFAPMLGAQRLPAADALNEAFHAAWLARYPKEKYVIGDYESIEAEFRRRFKWLSRPVK